MITGENIRFKSMFDHHNRKFTMTNGAILFLEHINLQHLNCWIVLCSTLNLKVNLTADGTKTKFDIEVYRARYPIRLRELAFVSLPASEYTKI